MISVRTVGPDGSYPTFLDQLGQVANWKHTKTYPGGAASATFDFIAEPTLDHPAVQGGRLLTALSGAGQVFTGRLEQPVPGTPWSCTVTGAAALAQGYQAHNGGSNIYNLDDTIDQAISEGLPWTRNAALTNPAGAAAEYSDTVDGALGQLVTQGGYWNLDARAVVTTQASTVGATYLLFAINPPPRTLTNYATVISLTYVDSGGATHNPTYTADAALIARYGTVYQHADLTAAGPLTATQVNAIGAALLARYAANGLPWSQGFTIGAGQLYTMGGAVVPDLATISAHVTVRVMELSMSGEITSAIDVPIGQVDYDDTAGQLTLTPLLAAGDSLVATIARAHHLRLTA